MADLNEMLLESVKESLRAAYTAVKEKGDAGNEQLETKADILTVADEAATRALLSYFKESRLPIIVYTEDAPPIAMSEEPKYAAVCDGIDGTFNYTAGSGSHGSIVGIAANPNPLFEDIVAAGFLEFNSGNLYYAVKEKRAYMVSNWVGDENRNAIPLRTSGKTSLSEAENVAIDSYSLGELAPLIKDALRPMAFVDCLCSGMHLSLLAAGTIDLFVTGDNCHVKNKRQTGEEIGPLYLLVKEAGGEMLDWQGRSLGNQVIGMNERRTFHAIAAATLEIGAEAAEKIRALPEVASYMERKGI